MMISVNNNVAAEQMDSIGRDFASKYYEAFTGNPDSSAFRRVFDVASKYSLVQKRCGRPDHCIQGVDAIVELADRMQYRGCAATVLSAVTTRVGHTCFQVSIVGELLRPAESDVPRKFEQTTVIKPAAWIRTEFVVVETAFEFDDDILDDVLPRPAGKKSVFSPSQAQADGANAVVGSISSLAPTKRPYVRTMDVFNSNSAKSAPKGTTPSSAVKSSSGPSKDDSNTAGTSKTAGPQQPADAPTTQSTESRAGTSRNYVTPSASVTDEPTVTLQTDKRLMRTPAADGSRVTCVRKAKKAAKDPMADCVPSYIGTVVGVSGVKQEAHTKKLNATGDGIRTSSTRADVACNVRASAVAISNGKPLAKTQPAAVKVTPKVKTPSIVEKAARVVEKRPAKGSRPEKCTVTTSTLNVKSAKTLVSKNRFGCLTVEDDGDDLSSSSSDEESPISLFTPRDFTGRKKRVRRNKLRRSPPNVEARGESSAPRHQTLAAVPDGPIVTRGSAVSEVVDEKAAEVVDEEATVVVDEEIVVDEEMTTNCSEPEKCPTSITNHSYIRQIGKVFVRAFTKEVIYPLCFGINPLEWW